VSIQHVVVGRLYSDGAGNVMRVLSASAPAQQNVVVLQNVAVPSQICTCFWCRFFDDFTEYKETK